MGEVVTAVTDAALSPITNVLKRLVNKTRMLAVNKPRTYGSLFLRFAVSPAFPKCGAVFRAEIRFPRQKHQRF